MQINQNRNLAPHLVPYLKQYLELSLEALALMPIKIRSSLNKECRSEKQNRELFQYAKDVKMFPKIFSQKILIQITANFHIIKTKRFQELVNNNNDCWILIQGIVKEVTTKNESQTTYNEQQNISDQDRDLRLTLSHCKLPQNYIQLSKMQIGQIYVGNINMNSDNKFISISDSSFLVLKRPIYEPIIYTSYLTEIKKRQEFFSSIPLFSKMYRSSLNNLISSMQQKEYCFGRKVFDEGDPIQYIYIVKQGSFLLEKAITGNAQKKNFNVTMKTEGNESSHIKKQVKHYRICPYKIISKGDILGDCQYLYNNQIHGDSLKSHQDGSKLYQIEADLFFKRLFVPEAQPQKINAQLKQKYEAKQKQIQTKLRINYSNSVIMKFMPSDTNRSKIIQKQKQQRKNNTQIKLTEQSNNSLQSLSIYDEHCKKQATFFQKFNKTITSQNKHRKSFRNRKNYSTLLEDERPNIENITRHKKNHSVSMKSQNQKYDSKTKSQKAQKKIPAIVKEVVQIVNLKKEYHKLRNLGKERKGAFQFYADNIPIFIRNKYSFLSKKPK